MAKMTMHQELDMLRIEVEALRKQKEEREKQEATEEIKAEEARQHALEEAEEKAEEIMGSVDEAKMDAKDGIHELLHSIKKDYENLSPVAAVVLFALGAAFGRALEKD
ncbi:MAG: hypothetical protein COB07_07465 [Sulfurovum sp.]|nr:MAG: hypothetical protein COB07_07465 [Sulfurovum sp.]